MITKEQKTDNVILFLQLHSALDLYGTESNLPPIISGPNSLWYRGYGDPAPETVIIVGFKNALVQAFFKSCEYSDTVKNSFQVRKEETTHHTSLCFCREPRKPWSELWQDMRWFQ